MLSISLLDLRIVLFNLWDVLLKDSKIINTKLPISMKYIYDFIADNILPEQLIVEVKNNKMRNLNNLSDSKIEPLSKYFNKNEYEMEINIIWKLLTSWIFKKGCVITKTIKKLEINEIYINFCIYFVSKNINTNYIYKFLLLIKEYFKNKNIENLNIL